MEVYLIVIIFLSLFSVLFDGREGGLAKSASFFMTLIFLTGLAGLRGEIGLDTITYSEWYSTFPPLNEMTWDEFSQARYEPLFKGVCSICRLFTDEWLLPQVLFALIINISIFLFIKNHTQSLFSCILLYFLGIYYVLNCEEIRQTVSFSIVLFAIAFLEKEKVIKYNLIVLVAVGFHFSSIIFFVLPFIKKLLLKPLWLFIISVILFIGAALVRDNLESIIFFLIRGDHASYFAEYSSGYMADGNMSRTVFNYISIMITSIFIPLTTYFLTRNDIEKNDTFLVLFVIYLFSAIINMQIVWFYRFVHILQLSAIIVMANGWRAFLMPEKSILNKILFLGMFTLYLFSLVSNSIFGYDSTFEQYRYELFVPYTLYFQI